MNQSIESKRSKQCSSNDDLIFVKQEIDDKSIVNEPISSEASSHVTCQSALKCEFDPDCGCKQCLFNKSRHIDSGAPDIKLEFDDDKTKVTIKTEFVTKCVKNEIKEEDYCGCNECLGVGSSNQYDQKEQAQTKTDLPVKDLLEKSVQSPANDEEINEDYGNIRDCPTPDYLPPFFSEDEDEDEEDESDDEVNHNSSRRSTRVANKPQKTYREEYSESDNDSSEYEPSEDEDFDEETEIEDNDEETELEEDSKILENTTKSIQIQRSNCEKKRNKKLQSANKGTKRNENSSDEVDIEALKKKKVKGKYLNKILILRLNCSECDETFKDLHSLNGHLHKRHKIFRLRCYVRGCSASFDHSIHLHRHQLAEHGQFTNKWPCALCALEIFKSYKGLVFHVWKMHQEGQFRCAYDGCQFESHSTRTVLINHYLTSHNKTTFTCQFQNCGMIFPNKFSLNRHSKVHTGEKTFKCEICKNRYRDNHLLKKHQLMVHEVGPMTQYECKWSKCKYVSINQNNVIRHIKRIHLKNGEQLDPKNFIVQKEITKNQVKSQKERRTILTLRLNCPVDCSDHFPDKSQLLDHLSKCHQIERFRCIVGNCMASFQNRAQLTTHKKEAHQMLKVWHCGNCDYQGKTYELLSIHITNAHEEGHFACGHSGCRFISRSNRNEVMKHRYYHTEKH